ncbi:MAG: glutamine-hydrolyzing carbamoyl-phosphate synthase small subunit [Spirochaetes bacterium]|nr:glutamine-hydrolyzing carbamoyl-phosphate synthase small subunit [Spirochaetota bacterium]
MLENGTCFYGRSFGAPGEKLGEVVFNTSLTGYQEILTDPSYKSQIVTMTYTEIGNYGTNDQDHESIHPWVEGFIVREYSKRYSNFRARESLEDYLKKYRIMACEDIDTRMLTRILRMRGSMNAILSTEDFNKNRLLKKIKNWEGIVGVDLVNRVTRQDVWRTEFYKTKKRYPVVVFDCGVKHNILRLLESFELQPVVVPSFFTYKEILALKPKGIMLSNGPGDPAPVKNVIETVKELLNYSIPTFGICLGNQMLGLALGGKTYKLKFGHHGGNHPVMNLKSRQVEITVQNHNFCVDIKSLGDEVQITHLNLNDKTCEGMKHKKLPLFSVQYHPEASPGPWDSRYLFKNFYRLIEKNIKK